MCKVTSKILQRREATSQAGFTLIELAITMALIGLIVLFAYPLMFHSVSGFTDVRNRTAAEAMIQDNVEMIRSTPNCATIGKAVDASGNIRISQAIHFRLSVSLPNGCVPGTVVPITMRAFKDSGDDLFTRKIQVLVPPGNGEFDVVGGTNP